MESTELVRRVVDGDTFETASMGGPVRLLNVDAPELHDRLGEEARRHLAQLMASRAVQVDFVDYDRHGRRLAWVKCDGRSVNHAMNEYLAEHGHSTEPPGLPRGNYRPPRECRVSGAHEHQPAEMDSDREQRGQGSRQHYVPRFWLNNFSPQKNNVVLTIDGRRASEARRHFGEDVTQKYAFPVREKSTRDMFQRRELFYQDEERMFLGMESSGAPAIREILAGAEKGDLSAVDKDQRSAAGKLLLSVMLRSFPYFLAAKEQDGATNIDLGDWLPQASDGMTAEESKNFVLSLSEWPSPIRGLVIAHIRDASMNFVTGDIPVANICENDSVGIFLPISPKVAVCFRSFTRDHIFEATAEFVSAVNGFIHNLSEKTIVQSQEHAAAVRDLRVSVVRKDRLVLCACMPGYAALARELGEIIDRDLSFLEALAFWIKLIADPK